MTHTSTTMTRLLRRAVRHWAGEQRRTAQDATDNPACQLVGRTLGGFVLERIVGTGGMGVVYQAADAALERKVAIKVLFAKSANDEHQRILTEARAAAAVTHPNVASIHTVGQDGGFSYIVMEFVDGVALRELMRRPISTKRMVELGIELASALAAAHARSIVHLDVNPSNVMVTRDGHVKVLDFGISGQTPPPGADETPSDSDTVAGTRGYAAPEHWEGVAPKPTMDVFSCGRLLQAMLQSQQRRGSGITRRRCQTPTPLERQLYGIAKRCLKVEPGGRFRNGSELHAALKALELNPTPTRRPMGVLAASVAMLVSLGAAGLLWTQWGPSTAFLKDASEPTLTPLTAEPLDSSPEAGALSFAGDRVALVSGGQLEIMTVEGRKKQRIAQPATLYVDRVTWLPDGDGLLTVATNGGAWGVWRVSLTTGQWEKYDDRRYRGIAVSPDGRYVAAYAGQKGVWLARLGPDEPFELIASPERMVNALAWSPDGREVAYVRNGERAPIVEVIRLEDRTTRKILEDGRLDSYSRGTTIAWINPETLVAAFRDEYFGFGSELWTLSVSSGDLKPKQRLIRLPMSPMAMSSDRSGARIFILGLKSAQMDAYVAKIDKSQKKLSSIRQLTHSLFQDYPFGWASPHELMISSNQTGRYETLLHSIQGRGTRPLLDGVTSFSQKAFNGDLVYWRASDGAVSLIRANPTGVETELFATHAAWSSEVPPHGTGSVRCAMRAERCIYLRHGAKPAVGYLYDYYSIDNLKTPLFSSTEVFGINQSRWDISPDGLRVAAISGGDSAMVLDVNSGKVTRRFIVPECPPQNVTWMADGRGLFITSARCSERPRVRLMVARFSGDRIEFNTLLGKNKLQWMGHSRASPDGRHVSFGIKSHDSDAWLIDLSPTSASEGLAGLL